MKKSKTNETTSGGLLLLLFLLLVHSLCGVLSCIPGVDMQSSRESYRVCTDEMTAFHKIAFGLPVSINTEGLEALTAVPGIGPKIAGLIVRERERRGGFESLGEIESIQGIGPALYGKIRPYLVL